MVLIQHQYAFIRKNAASKQLHPAEVQKYDSCCHLIPAVAEKLDSREQQLMLLYKDSLHLLKEILLVGQVAILILRLVSQLRFTVPSALEIIQAFIAALIYCRNYCAIESQCYILFNLFLIYALAYNTLEQILGKGLNDESALIEEFKGGYKVWGYAVEFGFRLGGLVIAWRCYQFSQMQSEEEDFEGE